VYSVGPSAFESHEQANGLKTVRASIYVVAEEDIVVVHDVAFAAVRSMVVRVASLLEEAKQVGVLPVDVAKDFHVSVFDLD